MAMEGFTKALMHAQKGGRNPPNKTRATMERAGGGGESPKDKKLNSASRMKGAAGKSGHGSAAGGRSKLAYKAAEKRYFGK